MSLCRVAREKANRFYTGSPKRRRPRNSSRAYAKVTEDSVMSALPLMSIGLCVYLFTGNRKSTERIAIKESLYGTKTSKNQSSE